MKLIGTLDAPVGVVACLDREIVYVPHPNFFGYDNFSYIVSDCPYQDQRQSEVTTLLVRLEGVNDAPTIAARDFNVSSKEYVIFMRAFHVPVFQSSRSGATPTKFTIEFSDIDATSAAGMPPSDERFGLKILSIPKMGEGDSDFFRFEVDHGHGCIPRRASHRNRQLVT